MSPKPFVYLLLPQLFKPLSLWHKDFLFTPICRNFEALFKKLVVSNEQTVQGLEESFFSNIGLIDVELPIAYYRYQINHDAPLTNLLCADPVHLEVGMNDISLTEKISDLSDNEAREIIQLLNQHFEQDGLEFIFGSNQHWYVSFPSLETVQTTPIDQVLGKNIVGSLPISNQRNWQVFQNEVQMLLHGSKVNQQREIAGIKPVNSIWFWGGGKPQHTKLQVNYVFSSLTNLNSTITGKIFAKAANCNWQELPEKGDELPNLPPGVNMVIIDQLFLPAITDNIEAYQRELTSIDENYIAPLVTAWQKNEIELLIDSCDGRILRPQKIPAWKFWVKPKTLLQLDQELSA